MMTSDKMKQINDMARYLYHKNAYRLYPYDADDLAQDVCLKLTEKYDGRDFNAALWFYGRRIVVDLDRKLHGRYTGASFVELNEAIVGDDDWNRQDLRISLDQLIHGVDSPSTDRDRDILNRHFVGGETQTEIAAHYSMTLGRVSQIISEVTKRRTQYEETVLFGDGNHPDPSLAGTGRAVPGVRSPG
jgi:RNA polymerase sigma factor (sigma-70 family)